MFQWQPFLRNGLWILGASIVVANISYASWIARTEDRRLQRLLAKRQSLRWTWLGLALIGAGLAATSQTTLELAIWIVFTLLALVCLALTSR